MLGSSSTTITVVGIGVIVGAGDPVTEPVLHAADLRLTGCFQTAATLLSAVGTATTSEDSHMTSIRKHSRLLVVAVCCVALGAGVSAIASAGAATGGAAKGSAGAKSSAAAKRARGGGVGRFAARAVSGDVVVRTKTGFATVS